MKFNIAILVLSCSICVSTEIYPDEKKNILKFGYVINYEYEEQLLYSIDTFYVVQPSQLSIVNNIPIRFRKMPVDCNNCDYLSPCKSKKSGHVLGDV